LENRSIKRIAGIIKKIRFKLTKGKRLRVELLKLQSDLINLKIDLGATHDNLINYENNILNSEDRIKDYRDLVKKDIKKLKSFLTDSGKCEHNWKRESSLYYMMQCVKNPSHPMNKGLSIVQSKGLPLVVFCCIKCGEYKLFNPYITGDWNRKWVEQLQIQ